MTQGPRMPMRHPFIDKVELHLHARYRNRNEAAKAETRVIVKRDRQGLCHAR